MHPSPRPAAQTRILATAGAAGAALLALSGCSRTGVTADPDPTVDAVWAVESIELDGTDVDLQSGLILLSIDTEITTAEAETGCRRLVGSFTLLDDGRAGFTFPGGTKPACDDDEEPWLIALDEAFADAIEQVDTWTVNDDELVLAGPASELLLRRSS